MALICDNLIELELQKLKFSKLKSKTNVINYLITDYNNKKHSIILENVNIPFGIEKYEGRHILNIEISPKKNNKHNNYYSMISYFEKELTDPENIKYEKILRSIENKGYYPNLRESKEGYIIRTHTLHVPEVYVILNTKNGQIIDKRHIDNVKQTKSNIELELGTFWITENNYGFTWFVKKIQILYSL
jgi:hypothetical protein